ncbi:restriction endonuclease subunit S [Halomonas ramblicola]|uniref:restriction endonuclease subunit S n=1 Tax=Halomonas ramblicola TaxID=747349 RepID=UPI0025B4147A|nr:restriction endonuclease subunit S [Halomonas ramblicola]MDN3521869.1 restriction endonuclease subunit S [Halomonas ramblicola]
MKTSALDLPAKAAQRPNQWEETELGEFIAAIESGKSFKCLERPPEDNEVGVAKVSAVTWGEYQEQESKTCLDTKRIQERLFIREGDFLFSRANTVELVGACVIAKSVARNIMLSDKILRLEFSGMLPRFVLFYLRSKQGRRQIELLSTGNQQSMRNIGQERIRAIQIPVPPLAEQRRIVAKIEELFSELDKGMESLKTARAQLKTYRHSLLKVAFEGRLTEQWRHKAKQSDKLIFVRQTLESIPPLPRPNRWKTRSKDVIYSHPCLAVGNPKTPLPKEWQWVPLVDVARMESGHTPSRRRPEWWDGDIPWIGIADARTNNGKIISETAQYTNEEGLKNSAARLLPQGTVCVSRTASVGYVVEMGFDMATSQDFVNWVPSQAVTSAWLRLIFGAHKEYLLRFSRGTTHRTIYFPEWLSVHIGLPPLEEQRRIVEVAEARLSELEALERTIEQSLGQSDALRQSILKCAFEGKLVPQNPDDEPASELLKRIRQAQANAPKPGRRKRQAEASA